MKKTIESGEQTPQDGSENVKPRTGADSIIETIKRYAARYDQLTLNEKLGLVDVIKADVKANRNRMAKELQDVDKWLAADGTTGATPQVGKRRGRKSAKAGGLTVANSILEALNKNGGTMTKRDLYDAATKVMGSKINDGTFNATVQTLKENKKIKSPGRGEFSL